MSSVSVVLRIVVALGAAASANAQAQTLYKYVPDEFLSDFLPDSAGAAISPTISDDGRYVVFQAQSLADPTVSVAYLVDRENPGEWTYIGQDCDDAYEPGLCDVSNPRLSGNGEYVIFDSWDSYTGGTFGPDWYDFDRDVFVWSRSTSETLRISLGMNGAEPTGESRSGDISRNGRYVVFTSTASNLVVPPSGAGPVYGTTTRTYWKDLQDGTTKLVHNPANLYTALYSRVDPRITDNGRYVLARDIDIQGNRIVNWDALTESVSYSATDDSQWRSPHNYVLTSDRRRISSIGYYPDYGYQAAMYRITSPNSAAYSFSLDVALGGGSEGIGGLAISSGSGFLAASLCDVYQNVFYHSLQIGTLGNKGNAIVYLTRGDAFECASVFEGIEFTPDGRYLVLSALDMARYFYGFGEDDDGRNDVFLVANPLWKPVPNTNLVASFTSIPANSRNVKVSADGTIGVFESEIPASEFGAYTDTNGTADVFRYLADFQQIELLSTDDGVEAFAGGARNPSMSQDGGTVVFEALDSGITAPNLTVAGKVTATVGYKASVTSVFRRQLLQNSLQRLSSSRNGGAPNGSSMHASISPDGRRVAYATDASNVNPGADPNAVRDVVVVDLDTGQRRCVSTCGLVVADGDNDRPSVGNNGHVAFESRSGAVQKSGGLSKASASAQIIVRDLIRGSNQAISRSDGGQAGNGASTRPSISASGRVVAYESLASNLDPTGSDGRVNVMRYVVGVGNRRLSRTTGTGTKSTAVDGDSAQPVVSGDGRFVSFQTAATNLGPGDANGVVDLVVHDSRTGVLQRLADGFGGAESNGASETPHLNYNGTVVGFHSYASNLSAEPEGEGASPTTAPYERDNPLAAGIVFADAFE